MKHYIEKIIVPYVSHKREFIEKIIVPFVSHNRELLKFDKDRPALAIFDSFKGQTTLPYLKATIS